MTTQGEAAALLATPPARSPWQRLYGAAHRARERYWLPRARSLPLPVLSVGNLHWGGTGKTPLVAALAARLRDRGFSPAILSRGYGGRGSGVRVVSTGEGPLLGPRVAGDEPVLLAGLLPGVSVLVGADRFAAGRHALERLPQPPGLFLLDDGFSHLALRRELNLLALPAADPLGGGRLPPGGRLREPLTASHRAHALVLTGARAGDPSGSQWAAALAPFGFRGEGFSAAARAGTPRLEDGRELARDRRVLAVAAVAHPEAVFATIEALGFPVAGRVALRDHHPYPEATLTRLRRDFAASGAEAILTTEKDAVKLRGRLALPLAAIPWRLEPETAFWSWFDTVVDRILSTARPGTESRTRR